MNSSFFSTRILLLTLFSNIPTYAMITHKDLEHPDICQHIQKNLPAEELNLRLVCKNWAKKNDQWKFMPDSVEKEYDTFVKRKGILNPENKLIILFILTAKNDLDAVKWLLPITTKGSGIRLMNEYTDQIFNIPLAMIAVHNNNPDMAQLLINKCCLYKDQNWKNDYDTITLPNNIATCLNTTNNRDFSFLFYLIAAWSDNDDNLQQLYTQKEPTPIGQLLIIQECLRRNAQNCFTFLLTKKTTKKIIKKDAYLFFKMALTGNTKDLPQLLIKNKLFTLNKPVKLQMTILDVYLNDIFLKNPKKAALLKELGAKTWAETQEEEIKFKNPTAPYVCTIQ